MRHYIKTIAAILFIAMLMIRCTSNQPIIKVGFATSVITDCGDKGSKSIHDELQGGVIWVESKKDTALLISVDLIGISAKETAIVKQDISNSTGVAVSKMFIAASHTHSSILMDSEKLGRRLAKTALAAKESTVPARFAFARVYAKKFNINRRLKVDDKLGAFTMIYNRSCIFDIENGTAETSGQVRDFLRYGENIYVPKYADMGPKIEKYPINPSKKAQHYLDNLPDKIYLNGAKDSGLDILSFYNMNDKLIGTLICYAAHPVIFRGSRTNEISADYPGVIKRQIAEHTGAPAHFMIGPCGNIKPISGEYGEKEMERYGKDLAALIISATKNKKSDILREFSFQQEVHRFDVAPDFLKYSSNDFDETVNRFLTMASQPFDPVKLKILQDKILRIWAGTVVKKFHTADKMDLNFSMVGFNDVVLTTLPGEIFSQTSLGIKNSFPIKDIVTIEMTDSNDPFYVPLKSSFNEGGYEVSASALVPGSAELMESIVKEMIKKHIEN